MAKERQYGDQSRKSKTGQREIAGKRRMFLEALEDRRLMVVPDVNGWYYPPIGKFTGDLTASLGAAEYARRSALQYGTGGNSASSGLGESSSPLNTTEIEPNSVRTQAQLLPLGTGAGQFNVVNVGGQISGNPSLFQFDEDYFAVNLRAGDIIDAALNSGPISRGWDVALFDANGSEIIGSTANITRQTSPFPIFPAASPFGDTTSLVTFAQVIPSTGRYYVRVADGLGPYSLRLRAMRVPIESQPINTKQIVFLDFDGAIINGAIFQIPGTRRLPSMMDTLSQYGFLPNQENEIIDKLVAKIKENYNGSLPSSGGNGSFAIDGRPGAFDIEFRNSRDDADPWGLPNVSRVIFGGGFNEFPLPVRGIAQSIDVGNFERQETAVVLPEAYFLPLSTAAALLATDDVRFIPRVPSASTIDVFTTAVSNTISHEMGHYFGLYHQDNTDSILTLMDQGGLPLDVTRVGVGPDGIFGTTDDVDIDFGRDRWDPGTYTGISNEAASLAFTLGTGTVGGTISGTSFNDRNRNARQDSGDEGLAGWEVFADINNNGVRDLSEPRTVTGAGGAYILQVAAGTYNVRIVRPSNWIPSTSSEVVKTVAAGGTANFGSVIPADTATGFKWLDANGDGIRDASESGLAGVYIYLDLDGDDRPDIGEPASITKADGSYSITPPGAGSYAIREVVEAGFVQTFPAGGEHVVSYDGVNPLRGFDFGNNESSDWGDAPAPYATTRAQNGASHGTTVGLRLGTNFDSDPDGRPSANADGDDLVGILNSSGNIIDDEDGATLLTPIVRGDGSNVIRVNVTNTAGSPAFIQGWIDFNGNGSWTDPGEQIATNVSVATSGATNITFAAPTNAVSRTYARFRLSQTQNLGPTGRSATGEVEDYVYSIVDGPRVLLQPDTFTVARNSRDNVMDVLANDFNLPGDAFSLTNVSQGTQGGKPVIDFVGQTIKYTPAPGFTGRDTFTYTATTVSGRRETATVSVDVTLQFVDPVAVDDSFDVPTNSISFPLSVLANDVEGRGGSLEVQSVTTPDKGGSVVIGSGRQSIRYSPRHDFGGTEQFSYTAVDGTGKFSTANIVVHTVQGDRADDEVEFSFGFLNAVNEPITEVRQGDNFKVVVFVKDLRPGKAAAETPPRNITDPGVYSAYLDLLYSSGLVAPVAPTGGTQDFAANFIAPYQTGRGGTAVTPGIIDELGAFVGSITTFPPSNLTPPANTLDPLKYRVVVLDFKATSAGIAEFLGDPADKIPGSEVTFYNAPSSARVANEKIRFGRSTIEVVPNGVNFPFAVDDTRFNVAQGNPFNIDVLTNDTVGTQPPIRISAVTQPGSGQTQINNNNTPNIFTDDTVTYIPNSNFVGLDQFKYTITDERGFTSTANVTVHVGVSTADDIIKLRLSATDLAGTSIDQITVGQQFQLRGFVEDLRTNPTRAGVFAAFQDILYSSNLVSVNASPTAPGFQVTYDPQYSNAKAGDIRIPGLINEIGSVQTSSSPTGLGEKLQFIVTLTARNIGTANFIGDPADIKPFHDSFVFDPTTPLIPSQIRYLSDSILVVATAGGSGSSGGEGNTNKTNAYDVNNDGFVSPIDVLILVNSLNNGGSGLLPEPGVDANDGLSGEGESAYKFFMDVNGDNYLSPLDALMVINELNSRQNGGSGEGEAAPIVSSSSGTTLMTELVDVPFAKKRASTSVPFVYGPLPSTEELEHASKLDEYMAQQASGEEEFDYLDGLAGDILRSK